MSCTSPTKYSTEPSVPRTHRAADDRSLVETPAGLVDALRGILAAGGNDQVAWPIERALLEGDRAVGVPVLRVKVGLFMTVSFLAWFMGMHTLYRFNTLQSGNGVGNEFLYIIAAVVGGTLLTGGFGNAIGVAIGAFIFGMTSLCIVYAGWDPNWFKAFLGVMLLLAVLVNLYVKRMATMRRAD